MLIVMALLVAWLVLNVALLGAAALANHHGAQRAQRSAPARQSASVTPLFR